MPPQKNVGAIWLLAFGYFAAYVPYSALTKALSSGAIGGAKLSGFSILPIATAASALGMITTITLLGWWRHAEQMRFGRWQLPRPGRWTLLSGVCTSAILLTTTLAYTFDGVSIVFMMLLMRGGVLVIAPIVDASSGRHVRWFSWVALVLSLLALLDAVWTVGGFGLTTIAAIDVVIYLASYFVRLRFMSRLAKGSPEANRKFFVEEQMVATPLALLVLASWALWGQSLTSAALRRGFSDVWASPSMIWVVIIGLCSQATGVFGGLVLLDPRENSFAVPVNRAASVLAGLCATLIAAGFIGGQPLSSGELVGAVLVVAAIAALTLGPRFDRAPAKSAS